MYRHFFLVEFVNNLMGVICQYIFVTLSIMIIIDSRELMMCQYYRIATKMKHFRCYINML